MRINTEKKCTLVAAWALALYCCCHAVGESAVITLVFPIGARSYSMGETGVALADDESAVFWNPAGLGLPNPRWTGGAVSAFFEPILPAFELPDLWHSAVALCIQEPKWANLGGFGLWINYLSFGENTIVDELGREVKSFRSYEQVMGLSWGCDLPKAMGNSHALGVSAKYIYSALAPGYGPHGEGNSLSCAVDVGYLLVNPAGMRLGLTLMNMGPSVYYLGPAFKDPIPFTVNLAYGYKRLFEGSGFKVFELAAEYRWSMELVRNHGDRPPDPFWKAIVTSRKARLLRENLDDVLHNWGCEMTLLNTFSVRQGVLYDQTGQRFEHHGGLGLSLLNHFCIDFGNICSPLGEFGHGARDRQWQISVSAVNLLNAEPSDLEWWKAVKR